MCGYLTKLIALLAVDSSTLQVKFTEVPGRLVKSWFQSETSLCIDLEGKCGINFNVYVSVRTLSCQSEVSFESVRMFLFYASEYNYI